MHSFKLLWAYLFFLCQEEEEEEVPEFVAEDEIEESDLSDIEVSDLELEEKLSHTHEQNF